MAKVGCPFVGLVPYTEDDAQFFFGRERDQQRILANLFASRLTILYGASGVGKSSVLRAGIVQEVRQRIAAASAAQEPPEVAAVYFKEWKGDIVAQLRSAIRAALLDQLGRDVTEGLAPDLTLHALLTAIAARFPGDLLLVLDQFEEFFLYHPSVSSPFAAQLAEAVNSRGLSAHFLLSLRDDAVSRLDRFKPLIPNLFSNYLRLRHLSADDAQRAILQAVRCYNALPADAKAEPAEIVMDQDLPAAIVEQVGTGRFVVGQVGQGRVASTPAAAAVEAPYLQLVMTRLWSEEISRHSTTLRLGTLTELGGAETIVKSHLEAALAGLSAQDRDLCARIFPHLVTPNGTKIAHPLVSLARFAKVGEGDLTPLLERLAGSDRRILAPVAPPDGEPGQLQYEIYHDSLAQAVLEWQARYELEQQKAVQLAARKRILKIAIGMGLLATLAIGGFVFALIEYRSALRERSAALAARAEAEREHLARQLAEAERTKNFSRIAELQKQYDQTDAEIKAFKGKGDTLAEIVVERDRLRQDVAALRQQLAAAPKNPAGAAEAPNTQTPVQTVPPQKKDEPKRDEKPQNAPAANQPIVNQPAGAPVKAKSPTEIALSANRLLTTNPDLALSLAIHVARHPSDVPYSEDWPAVYPILMQSVFPRQFTLPFDPELLVFSPDNKTVAVSSDTTFCLYDVVSGTAPDCQTAIAWRMQFSGDGSHLALGGNQIDYYDLRSRTFVRGPKNDKGVADLAVEADNRVFFAWRGQTEAQGITFEPQRWSNAKTDWKLPLNGKTVITSIADALSQTFFGLSDGTVMYMGKKGFERLPVLDRARTMKEFADPYMRSTVYIPLRSRGYGTTAIAELISNSGRNALAAQRVDGALIGVIVSDFPGGRPRLIPITGGSHVSIDHLGSTIALSGKDHITLFYWGKKVILANLPGRISAFSPNDRFLAVVDGQVLKVYPGDLETLLQQIKPRHTLTTAECRDYLGLDPCPAQ